MENLRKLLDLVEDALGETETARQDWPCGATDANEVAELCEEIRAELL